LTFTAKFKVEDVGEGPAPIDVLAVARVEDDTLTQNTEKAKTMELRIQLDTDETALKIGDEIPVNGHFVS
jgi:hypothetical protein